MSSEKKVTMRVMIPEKVTLNDTVYPQGAILEALLKQGTEIRRTEEGEFYYLMEVSEEEVAKITNPEPTGFSIEGRAAEDGETIARNFKSRRKAANLATVAKEKKGLRRKATKRKRGK